MYEFDGGGRGRHCPRGQIDSFLEPCLLMLLHHSEAHGYELAERLAECDFRQHAADPSLIYRCLRGMENRQLVISEWRTHALTGPPRRIYSLTALGDYALAEWVCFLADTGHAIERFLAFYNRHMIEGRGEHHATLQGEPTMKIAVVTDDGETISQHFGRAAYYTVVTVENGQVTRHEMRPKLGHRDFAAEEGGHAESDTPGQRHGFDAASQDKHTRMAAAISDCQVLLCRGMGWGAYESMKQFGVTPIVTDVEGIDQAVATYLAGAIVNHVELLH